MNWVSLVYFSIIAVLVLEGIHRGFLRSSFSLGAFFLSIITSYLFYPVMSTSIKANPTLYNYFLYYTEGYEKIASFENTRLLVDGISQADLNEVLSTAKLSEPFISLIRQNVEAKAFSAEGLTTMGDYFNMTLVAAVLNIISFVAIFIIARVIFAFVLGAVDYTVQFPELRQYNRTSGALFGATHGLLFCFLVSVFVPVVFLIFPVPQLVEFFEGSSVGAFFRDNNFFAHLIRGVI